jgi:Lipopolysaccharide-assembly
VSGSADALPKTIHTIAVTQVRNSTTQYKVSDLLGVSISREFISRTRYKVVVDPAGADATLLCGVVNFISYPTIVDPTTSRATGVQAILTLNISLRDKNGAILFYRPNFEVRERYEISIDPKNYFDESEPAMQRLAVDVARSVVTAVLEKF